MPAVSASAQADLTKHADASPAAPPSVEGVEGSYFVAAYPPFSRWRPERLPAWRRCLAQRPSPGASPPLGLYVHLPFCAQRCDFCYYLAYADARRGRLGEYIEALGRESVAGEDRPRL